jgi:hypothetical protein
MSAEEKKEERRRSKQPRAKICNGRLADFQRRSRSPSHKSRLWELQETHFWHTGRCGTILQETKKEIDLAGLLKVLSRSEL